MIPSWIIQPAKKIIVTSGDFLNTKRVRCRQERKNVLLCTHKSLTKRNFYMDMMKRGVEIPGGDETPESHKQWKESVGKEPDSHRLWKESRARRQREAEKNAAFRQEYRGEGAGAAAERDEEMFEKAMGEEPLEKIPEGLDEGVERELVIELMRYSELLEDTSKKLSELEGSLQEEKMFTKAIRDAGGTISKEAAQKIKALENKKAMLLKMYDRTLNPHKKAWLEAYINSQDLLVEKPEKYNQLFDITELSEADLAELPSEGELTNQEMTLLEKETEIEEEIDSIIDDLNQAPEISGDVELDKGRLGMMQTHLNAQIKALRNVRKSLDDVRENLGLARGMSKGRKAA